MRMKTIAPRIGPTRVPMPPMITIMSPWPEKTQNMTSGEAGEHRGDHEDDQLERAWIAPEAREAPLVLANGLERPTERRADDRPAEPERAHDAGGDQEVE